MNPFFSTISSWNLDDQQDIAKQFQSKFRRLRDQVVRVKKANAAGSYYLWDDLEYVLENMIGWLPDTLQDNTGDNGTEEECIPNGNMCPRWMDSIQKWLEAMPIDQMTWSIDLMYDIMYNMQIKNSKTNFMNIETVSSFAPTINNTSYNCLKAIHTNFLGILQGTLDIWVEEKSKVAMEKFNLFRYICKMGMEGRLCKDTTFTDCQNSSILDCSTISIIPMADIDESACENI